MFAIVRSGGKQYRVADDAELVVDRLHADVGARLDLETLLVGDGADLGAGSVAAEVIGHVRGDKIIIFKKKRRHNYRRKNGHRSELTVLRILPFGDAARAEGETHAASVEAASVDAVQAPPHPGPVEPTPDPAPTPDVSAAVHNFLAGDADTARVHSTEATHGA